MEEKQAEKGSNGRQPQNRNGSGQNGANKPQAQTQLQGKSSQVPQSRGKQVQPQAEGDRSQNGSSVRQGGRPGIAAVAARNGSHSQNGSIGSSAQQGKKPVAAEAREKLRGSIGRVRSAESGIALAAQDVK